MNNAAKGLRRAISNIDMRVIGPTITMAFTNEMLYNPDDSIKGDCIVVARGAAAILIKESAQARRTQFLAATANPIDMEIIGIKGRASLLREVASAMELPVDEVVPTDEQLDERQASAAEGKKAEMKEALEFEAAKADIAFQNQLKLEEVKTKARVAGDQQAETIKVIGDVVKQAMQAAQAEHQAKNAAAPEGKGKPKRVKYSHNDDGLIEAAELEE